MPGVIDPSLGFAREVGKMSFLHEDISSIMAFNSVEEFADKLMSIDVDLLSPPPSSSSSPSRDNGESETELLPADEKPVDLLNLLEGDSFSFGGLSAFANTSTFFEEEDIKPDLRALKESCRKDPFMGHRDDFFGSNSAERHLVADSILGQFRPDDLLSNQTVQAGFSAWGHTPDTDDDEPVLFPGSSSSSTSTSNIVDSSFNDHDTLPDTPMSYSGTATGDDSDVDIETIPDTPDSVELCGYSSSDTSSDLSPAVSPSPLQNHNKISILQRYSSHLGLSSSSKPSISYNGVSSSASLEENLMCGRSIAGKKRKHHKDKYSKHSTHVHTSFNTYYPSGNSVNFHDYAMSPSSCLDTETAQPTVFSSSSSSSKRMYKRKQLSTLDLSDKEKQNHHNQLERNRRQKLADLFVDLRDEVPSISQQSKASKVMILNQATSYIGELQRLHRSQDDILTKELHKKEYLKKQLRQIEAQLSLK